MKRVLYISYDGITQPLGQSQVAYYLYGLARKKHTLILVNFEKPEYMADDDLVRRISEDLRGHGIEWHPLRYHKRPLLLGTLWDIVHAIVRSIFLIARRRIDIVHGLILDSFPKQTITILVSRRPVR